MRCYFQIDAKKTCHQLDRIDNTISIDFLSKEIDIDYVRTISEIERTNRCLIGIDRPKYKVIRVNIPVSIDFSNLQNRFLPNTGEYYLNS